MHVIYLVVGFILLLKGADWSVSGSSAIARKYGISSLTIGLTIVAFGTSAPELVVNAFASWQGHQDIVYGNILGSNNFNLFAILGLCGIITPMVVQSRTVKIEIPVSLAAVLLLWALSVSPSGNMRLSTSEGIILLLIFLAFLWYVYKSMKDDRAVVSEENRNMSSWKPIVLALVGLLSLVAGGKLVVDNAVIIASGFGLSERIIGLTIVAAGTSLPELATSMTAAFRKENDIAVGNVIGSNIFNSLFILPVSATIRPVAYTAGFSLEFILFSAGTLFLLLAMFTGGRNKLDRWEAAILLIVFLLYSGYTVSLEL